MPSRGCLRAPYLLLQSRYFFFSPLHSQRVLCEEGRPRVIFLFHLGMNSISQRARFTEPTRENKDVLIRNIRGEKGIAFVNEL